VSTLHVYIWRKPSNVLLMSWICLSEVIVVCTWCILHVVDRDGGWWGLKWKVCPYYTFLHVPRDASSCKRLRTGTIWERTLSGDLPCSLCATEDMPFGDWCTTNGDKRHWHLNGDIAAMDDKGDVFTFENLGGGQEVGRSCHILQFKGKCVMVESPCCGECSRLTM